MLLPLEGQERQGESRITIACHLAG